MKKILPSILVSLFFATNAFANCITDAVDVWFNKMDCTVFWGYATADMNVNGSIADIDEESHGIKPENKNALMIGTGASCDIGGNFKVCTKMFLVHSGLHEIDQKTSKGKKIGGNFHSGLLPIMAGVSYNRNISEKFSLNGKLFLGYGAAFFGSHAYVIENDENGVEHKNRYKYIYESGICFVSDLSIGAEYVLTKKYKLGLDVGYRFTPTTTILEGTKLDFSGFTAALSCSF